MEQKFKENDVVKLKSGTPNMTVSGYITRNTGAVINTILKHSGQRPEYDEIESQIVVCVWFDGNKRETGEFNEGALELS